jgi:hypothetical protein
MHNNIFQEKYTGSNAYLAGWSVAMENFQQLETEEGRKKKWGRKLRDWLKGAF